MTKRSTLIGPRAIFVAVALCLSLAAGPAFAHHSFAMFDRTKPTPMKGTVKQVDWTNPHVTLWVYVETKPGAQPEVWNLECANPSNLKRNGFTKRTFNPGDKVDIVYLPSRDGSHSGQLRKIISATGQSYSMEK
jgi:hypothetical protein